MSARWCPTSRAVIPSPMPPLRTTNVDDNPVVEISSTNAALLNAWSPLDLLDPTRVTYLTYENRHGSPVGVDNEHANAIIDDTNDNSIIVSLRNQNAVFKFSRSTGQLKWILGPPALWGDELATIPAHPGGHAVRLELWPTCAGTHAPRHIAALQRQQLPGQSLRPARARPEQLQQRHRIQYQ